VRPRAGKREGRERNMKINDRSLHPPCMFSIDLVDPALAFLASLIYTTN
jgi:hypothetical protein